MKIQANVFNRIVILIICSFGFACTKTENVNLPNIARNDETKVSPINYAAPRYSKVVGAKFIQNFPANVALPDADDIVSNRVLKEYGAMFVARNVTPLPTLIFADEREVSAWQSQIQTQNGIFGNVNVKLQTAAMQQLIAARDEARSQGLSFTARGTLAGSRTYAQAVEPWTRRVKPALVYWRGRGRLSASEAARIVALEPSAQTAEILKLEEQKIYFSKDYSKSIIYSCAAPGSSQHLAMLAFDLNENGNAALRRILAKHGWFQTVISDLPHFTFLGADENELPNLGLRKITSEGRAFWLPQLSANNE